MLSLCLLSARSQLICLHLGIAHSTKQLRADLLGQSHTHTHTQPHIRPVHSANASFQVLSSQRATKNLIAGIPLFLRARWGQLRRNDNSKGSWVRARIRHVWLTLTHALGEGGMRAICCPIQPNYGSGFTSINHAPPTVRVPAGGGTSSHQ